MAYKNEKIGDYRARETYMRTRLERLYYALLEEKPNMREVVRELCDDLTLTVGGGHFLTTAYIAIEEQRRAAYDAKRTEVVK